MKKTILVWATVMAAGMLALSGCGKKETAHTGEIKRKRGQIT